MRGRSRPRECQASRRASFLALPGGLGCGSPRMTWAKKTAEAAEFERLEWGADQEWESIPDKSGSSAYSIGERLVFYIRPEVDGDRQAANEFWESVTNADDRCKELMGDTDFVNGFVAAARVVWEAIKSSTRGLSLK